MCIAPTDWMCQTCQGNGEIVIDWDKYLGPTPSGETRGNEDADHGVEECPDCDGTGRVASAPSPITA